MKTVLPGAQHHCHYADCCNLSEFGSLIVMFHVLKHSRMLHDMLDGRMLELLIEIYMLHVILNL